MGGGTLCCSMNTTAWRWRGGWRNTALPVIMPALCSMDPRRSLSSNRLVESRNQPRSAPTPRVVGCSSFSRRAPKAGSSPVPRPPECSLSLPAENAKWVQRPVGPETILELNADALSGLGRTISELGSTPPIDRTENPEFSGPDGRARASGKLYGNYGSRLSLLS